MKATRYLNLALFLAVLAGSSALCSTARAQAVADVPTGCGVQSAPVSIEGGAVTAPAHFGGLDLSTSGGRAWFTSTFFAWLQRAPSLSLAASPAVRESRMPVADRVRAQNVVRAR